MLKNKEDKVQEITIVDLISELKKKILLIIVIVAVCLSGSAYYNFFMAKPVYQYSSLLQFPYNFTNSLLINTYIQVIKEEIGIENVRLLAGTNMLRLTFTNNDLNFVKEKGDKLTNLALNKLNAYLYEINEKAMVDKGIPEIRESLKYIEETIGKNNFTNIAINENLEYVKNKLNILEETYLSKQVVIVAEGKGKVQQIAPRKAHNILLAGITGFILSVGFVMMRFIWKITR